MVDSTALSLRVLSLSGACFDVEAESTWSVKELKFHLSSLNNIPHHQQRILLGSRVLNDAEVFAKVFPQPGKTHELMLVCCEDPEKTELLVSLALGRLTLSKVAEKYREDYDVVEVAVRKDGMQLEHATGAPRQDQHIIMTALATNGYALCYAKDFRADREAVLTAVRSNSFAITLADPSLQHDSEFAAEAVKKNSFVQDYLEKFVIEDPDFRERVGLRPLPTKKDSVLRSSTNSSLAPAEKKNRWSYRNEATQSFLGEGKTHKRRSLGSRLFGVLR